MTHSPLPIAPILLDGELHETIWGGRAIEERLRKTLPQDALIGESWETANESRARSAPYAGMTLGELVDALGEQLVGRRAIEVYGRRFPLLTKFIDARQQLSVQVHPDDEYAAEHESGKLGKTETWLILHAEPGARLVYGLRHEVTPADVRQAIDDTRLEELLNSFEARLGDVLFVPPGTVHAIGAGVLLYELQEYSDVTYRLYDYGRLQANGRPRELHIERAMDVMRYAPAPVERVVSSPAETIGVGGERRVLVACRYFVEEQLRFSGSVSLATTPASCQIHACLGGACTVRAGDWSVELRLGDSAVLPAALGGYTLDGDNAHLIRSYVPESDDAGWRAWRAAQPVLFEDC